MKFTDSPGVNVCGVVSPEMLNPLPVALTDLIATLAEPPLVKRSGWVTGLPTFTLPKPMTDGVTLRRLVDPVPFRLPAVCGPCALIATKRLTLSCAAEVGLNTTVSFALWPGANVSGAERPEIVNPVPLAETFESVNFAAPLLLTVTL